MQINIVSEAAVALTGLMATSGIKQVKLTWDLPTSPNYKSTQVYVGSSNDLNTATLLGATAGNSFDHITEDVALRFYWIRAVNIFDRVDGPWLGPITGAGKLVEASDLNVTIGEPKALVLVASSQIFSVSKTGALTPSATTLTALAQNVGTMPVFTVVSGNATLVSADDGWARTISAASMTTDSLTVKIEADGLMDEVTIVKLREGLDGVAAITGLLTNEAANISADSAGNVSSFLGTGGEFKVFDGLVNKTGDAAVTYSVQTETGIDISIAATGIYTVSSMSADSGTATLRAVYKGVTIDKVYSLVKSKAGPQGPQGNTGTGSQGATGNSYVTAYCASTSTTATSAPANTAGVNSVPATDSGGISGSWSKSVPSLATGQYLYQVDGIYNPSSGVVTWSIPYWSSLRVGSLSAITANLGTVTAGTYRTATSGMRIEINEGNNNSIKAYNSSNDPVLTLSGAGSGIVMAYSYVGPALYGNNLGSGIAVQGLTSSGTGGWFEGATAIMARGGTGAAIQISTGSNGILQNGGGTNWLRTLNPSDDGAWNLGTSGQFRWNALFANSSSITTSDERTKTDIVDCPLGLAFILDLRSIQYRQLVAENIVVDNWVEVEPARLITDDFGDLIEYSAVIENQKVVTPRPGVRLHHGLPAGQVKATLDAHGVPDAALWTLADKDDPLSQQALRYEEFIAPLIKAVQELSAELTAAKVRIAALEATL